MPPSFQTHLNKKRYFKTIKCVAPYISEVTRLHRVDSHMNAMNKVLIGMQRKYGDERPHLKNGIVNEMDLAEMYIHMSHIFEMAIPGYKQTADSAIVEMTEASLCTPTAPKQMYNVLWIHLLHTFMKEVSEIHVHHKKSVLYNPTYAFDFNVS